MKKTEFAYFAFLIVVAICCFASGGHAASVGPSGYTNDFSTQPIAADWSTYAPPGGNTTYGSAGDIDAAMATLDVSTIIQDLTVDAVNPPAATGNATWCSSGFFVQTRPTSVAGTMMMCTLVNNIGGAASSVTISYDFAKVAVLAEEIDGHRVYYSLSGQPGSWALIAAFSSVAP